MAQELNLPFIIRLATAADIDLLAEIGAETFRDTFKDQNSPENMALYLAESFGHQQQALELADPASCFLIAEVASEPVGYAHLKGAHAPVEISGRKPMEIARIYARKAWIGKGIGARLMQACLSQAAQEDCDVVWLGVWELNPRAIAFYREWGFREVGTHVFQLGNDPQRDVLMARPVTLGPEIRQ